MTQEFDGVFEFHLEEWDTETHPCVIVGYNFYKGDETVGEKDWFEIVVIRNKKDIWPDLSENEQKEIELACVLDMKDQND
jgi:hypothetical protein